MLERIVCEGIIDYRPGFEFDVYCAMVLPVVIESTPGNDGGIDSLVEDYAIDVSIGILDSDIDESDIDTRPRFMAALRRYRKRELEQGDLKGGQHVRYWKRTIEVFTDSADGDEEKEIYRTIERVGAGADNEAPMPPFDTTN